MLTRWGSENFICYECFPWNVLLLKLMHDYKGMVKDSLHLMIIISLLCNVCHLVNVAREKIGYVKYSDSSDMHKKPDMI